MKRSREYMDYLRDMLDNAQKALSFVNGMNFDEFSADDKTTYAVVRALEIIGEATKKIPKDLQESYPEIPWREIAGTRDKLIQEYTGINLAVVWRTVQEDLPLLVDHILGLISDFGESQ